MAGSRIKKLGTVFTRVEGLLKAGAVQHEDRPIWYDVYAAFPPLEEPNFYRQPTTDSVKNIFYPEDAVRARFYRQFSQGPAMDLQDHTQKSLCQRFVEKHQQLHREQPDLSEEELFQATCDSLAAEGVTLRPATTQEDLETMGRNRRGALL